MYNIKLTAKLSCVKEPQVKTYKVHCPKDIAKEEGTDMRQLAQEAFFIITLDQQHKYIDKHLISLGTLTQSIIHPREVFTPALLDHAAAIICMHNHPSGNTKPSAEDEMITKRLQDAADIMGIRLIDHIIIGRESEDQPGYFSFQECGLL